MSLQFIIGKQTADKRKEYIEEIHTLMNEKKDAQIFVVVPEHAKFEGEMTILKDLWKQNKQPHSSYMGSIDLQVFSFTRLAWFFLKDEPIFQKRQLSDAGISMLIRKVLMEKEEELILFRKEVDKEGFITQLADLFRELRAGRITVEDLEKAIPRSDENIRQLDIHTKVQEISLLYDCFCEKMGEEFIQYEMILEALAANIAQNKMQNVYLYIDGFSYFSAQEMQIISSFLENAEKVTLALDLDQAYVESPPEMQNLFYTSGTTYHKLYHFARDHGVKILQDRKVVRQTDGYKKGFIDLDEYWVRSSSGSRKPDVTDCANGSVKELMEVWGCDSKQAEIFHVANSINRLVAEEGYRYKDFLILARRVEDYETILKPMFAHANLHVFYDKAEEMRHHPFTDFIDSLYRIRLNYWRYPDIMRFLRTELLVPFDKEHLPPENREERNRQVLLYRDAIDKTENILLAYGFEGNAWLSKNNWKIHSFEERADEGSTSPDQTDDTSGIQEANFIKQFLQKTLLPFYQNMAKAKTGREAAILLYQFLQKNGIDRQMIDWRDAALENNDLERARQHEQVWKTFTLLLDEYVDTLGDSPFDDRTFHDILMTGFEAADFSIVPPSIDEVIFSSMEGARFTPAKVVYILGATQENLPIVHENRSLLTEEEREVLNQHIQNEEKYLRPSITETTAAEPFIAYLAFLSGTERLFITYPLSADGNSRISKLSPYVQRIIDEMEISVQYRAADITDAENPDHFAGTKRQNMGQVIKLLRYQQTTNEKMPMLWRKILSYLTKDKESKPTLDYLFQSLWHKNQPVPLTPEIAEKLYGKNLYLSVSQLESYYEDSYSHFLQYGLRLKERQKYELSAAGTGEFYHEALENIVRQMRSKKDLNQREIQQITNQVLQSLFGSDKYAILSSSNRMKFIQEQLGDTIQKMSWVIHGHQSLSTLQNVRTEAIFGQPGNPSSLQGLHFPLKNDQSLFIRGKIDRIDKMEAKERAYLTILDYKSSSHTFDFTDAYYGLAMQMITYLDVAMLNAEQLIQSSAQPAGAFYLHVKNPFMEEFPQRSEEEARKQILSENKWKGLLIADKDIASALDPSVEGNGSSLILPIRYKKDGSFAAVNDLVTFEDLELLILNNRRRIQEAGERILSGELKLNPIKDFRYTPSVQGPYRAVSQFDSTLKENRYRRLEKMGKKEVLQKLREELSLKEDEEEEKKILIMERGEEDVDDSSQNKK